MRRHYWIFSIVLMWFYGQLSLPITETFRHPFPDFDLFRPEVRSFSLVLFCKEKGGRTWVTSGRVLSVLMKFVFFTDFSLTSVRRWPMIIRPFSLCYSIEQLSACGEGDQPTPNADLESGQVKTSSSSVSAPLDLSQDGDLAPPSSILAGLTGPIASHQDLPLPASLPVLAGSKDLAGVLSVPPPPEEPYDAFLLRTGCTKQDSASLVPQPATVVPPQDPVTLPAALPQLFATYEGPFQTLRDPFPAPRRCMPLPGRFYMPPPQAWPWPGQGSTVPDLNMHLYQPVPPRPDAGAASDTFLSSVGRPPTPHPQQLTMGSTDQTPSSPIPPPHPNPPPPPTPQPQPPNPHPPTPTPHTHTHTHTHTRPSPSTISGTCILPLRARPSFWTSDSCSPLHLLPRHLPLCLHHPSLMLRPLRLLHLCCLHLQTFWHWWRTGKTPSGLCRTGCRFWWMMLHPSRPWVPLFSRIWTPTGCGSWVPLVTERHHGLNISQVQRERAVAPGPGAPQVMRLRPVETAGLAYDSFETPVPHHLHPANHCHHPNGWEPIATVQYVALALRTTAGEALVSIPIMLLLTLMPAIIAIPMPHTPIVIGPEISPLFLVGLPRPAWLGDLPRTCPCRPDAVLLRTQHSDHPGAIVRPLAPGRCPPIATAVTLPLGHLHLAGDRFPVLTVLAPGLLTGILNDACTRRTNVFSGFVTFLLFLNRMKTWMLTRIRQLTIPSYRRRQSRNFLTIYSVLQLSPITLTLIQLGTRRTFSWCHTIRMQLKPRPQVMEMN